MQPSKEVIALSLETNKALKALGWGEHEFKKGDWVIAFGESALIKEMDADYLEIDYGLHSYRMAKDRAIPLLHWEQIEAILKENNRKAYISVSDSGDALCQICFPFRRKGRYNVEVQANGKTRQLAVMRAVIALAEKKD